MKWIHFLINCNITYYIYKLNQEDTIIMDSCLPKINKMIIILYGSILCVKIFSNQEVLPIAILNNQNLFKIEELKSYNKFYYQLKALEKTYIITFNSENIYKKKIKKYLLTNILCSYENTLKQYEIMSEIISQKYIKKRIFQIILLLLLKFGKINQNRVYLPFKISYKNLASLTGTNKTTVGKIIKQMNRDKIIHYYKKKRICTYNIFNLILE
uniref:Global nitrogen transcriptional regulator n=1 Tax=Osmundaria fimbriata TaxID=228265 RepID=A0A1Z1M4E2_OSMFI|nr:global nitrogen transcriptional regulator [Osmundaria fimbriata]ARW60927.1 global nitrogen transcriptional regulator [Osmundaria fimbriata]